LLVSLLVPRAPAPVSRLHYQCTSFTCKVNPFGFACSIYKHDLVRRSADVRQAQARGLVSDGTPPRARHLLLDPLDTGGLPKGLLSAPLRIACRRGTWITACWQLLLVTLAWYRRLGTASIVQGPLCSGGGVTLAQPKTHRRLVNENQHPYTESRRAPQY
jgi:hypothetical protein